jgi:hypothetical protein
MVRARRLAPMAIAILIAVPFAAACSEETQQNARDTAESLGEDAEANAAEASARAAAEELRVRIKANATAATQGPRSMVAIAESSEDIVGDPEVVGATDADGDGLDDDGKVQVNVSGASACVTLPATGDDTTVNGGAC